MKWSNRRFLWKFQKGQSFILITPFSTEAPRIDLTRFDVLIVHYIKASIQHTRQGTCRMGKRVAGWGWVALEAHISGQQFSVSTTLDTESLNWDHGIG